MVDLRELCGMYQGERCFMIGNGPSLRQAPFDLLHGEYTFGMNRIGLITEYTDWIPRFYVFTSSLFDSREVPLTDMLLAIDTAEVAFIWDKYRNQSDLKVRNNIAWVNVSHTRHYKPGGGDNGFWSDDASLRVSKYGTTMFAALQLAAYLGFSPLYVIGADGYQGAHTASEPDINHFHPRYHRDKKASWPPVGNAFSKHVYELSLAACERLGVEIYDATPTPGYGVLPKADMAEVLHE
jgi:hypothetical protein